MHKKRLLLLLGFALVLLLVPCVVLGPYYFRVQHFKADPAQGYYADFYLYVSPGAKRTAQTGAVATLLVQPNNSGINADDPAVHRRDAWWMGFGRHGLADDLGVVLLIPAFLRPAEDWQIYTHALDRDVLTTERTDLARLDLQLLAMVDHARAVLETEGLPTDAAFLLQGYSASGMFANRFTALHPRRVKAVAAGSPGGWPIAPVTHYQGEALPYPAGIADLEALTGHPFDSTAYRAVPQLIVMGALDDNDALDFTDGWGPEAAAQVDRLFGPDPLSRWDGAQALYHAAGATARFLLVNDVGHDRKALQHYSTAFLMAVLANP